MLTLVLFFAGWAALALLALAFMAGANQKGR
jgi:hypothetical protein